MTGRGVLLAQCTLSLVGGALVGFVGVGLGLSLTLTLLLALLWALLLTWGAT